MDARWVLRAYFPGQSHVLLRSQRDRSMLRGCLSSCNSILLSFSSFKVLAYLEWRSPSQVISILSVGRLFWWRNFLFNLYYPLVIKTYRSCRLVSNLSVATLPKLLLKVNTAVILRHKYSAWVNGLFYAHVHLVPVFAHAPWVIGLNYVDLTVWVVGFGVDCPCQAVVCLVNSD
jgi:hypothetical protein